MSLCMYRNHAYQQGPAPRKEHALANVVIDRLTIGVLHPGSTCAGVCFGFVSATVSSWGNDTSTRQNLRKTYWT